MVDKIKKKESGKVVGKKVNTKVVEQKEKKEKEETKVSKCK